MFGNLLECFRFCLGARIGRIKLTKIRGWQKQKNSTGASVSRICKGRYNVYQFRLGYYQNSSRSIVKVHLLN